MPNIHPGEEPMKGLKGNLLPDYSGYGSKSIREDKGRWHQDKHCPDPGKRWWSGPKQLPWAWRAVKRSEWKQRAKECVDWWVPLELISLNFSTDSLLCLELKPRCNLWSSFQCTPMPIYSVVKYVNSTSTKLVILSYWASIVLGCWENEIK